MQLCRINIRLYPKCHLFTFWILYTVALDAVKLASGCIQQLKQKLKLKLSSNGATLLCTSSRRKGAVFAEPFKAFFFEVVFTFSSAWCEQTLNQNVFISFREETPMKHPVLTMYEKWVLKVPLYPKLAQMPLCPPPPSQKWKVCRFGIFASSWIIGLLTTLHPPPRLQERQNWYFSWAFAEGHFAASRKAESVSLTISRFSVVVCSEDPYHLQSSEVPTRLHLPASRQHQARPHLHRHSDLLPWPSCGSSNLSNPSPCSSLSWWVPCTIHHPALPSHGETIHHPALPSHGEYCVQFITLLFPLVVIIVYNPSPCSSFPWWVLCTIHHLALPSHGEDVYNPSPCSSLSWWVSCTIHHPALPFSWWVSCTIHHPALPSHGEYSSSVNRREGWLGQKFNDIDF